MLQYLKTDKISHEQVPVVRKRLPTKMRQPEVFFTQVELYLQEPPMPCCFI